MKTHTIFRKVGSILGEINEQYQYLSESPENLNDLELELLSANADFLAEHIKVLKKLNLAQDPAKAEVKASETVFDSAEYKQSLHADPSSRTLAEDLIKQEFPEAYSFFNKPVPYKEQAQIKNDKEDLRESSYEALPEKPSEEERPQQSDAGPQDADKSFSTTFVTAEPEPAIVAEPVKETEPQPDAEKPMMNEVISDEKGEDSIIQEKQMQVKEPNAPTLNEIMSAQRTQGPALSRLSKPQHVSDLKSIINLNDKLLFIKDLFNGYSLAYSEAIEIINRFDSFDAADNFLKTNYSVKNNWASRQATAEKFYQLLNRRFSVQEGKA